MKPFRLRWSVKGVVFLYIVVYVGRNFLPYIRGARQVFLSNERDSLEILRVAAMFCPRGGVLTDVSVLFDVLSL